VEGKAVLFGRWIPTLQRNLQSPYSGYKFTLNMEEASTNNTLIPAAKLHIVTSQKTGL
jgi:hypothetical protein